VLLIPFPFDTLTVVDGCMVYLKNFVPKLRFARLFYVSKKKGQ